MKSFKTAVCLFVFLLAGVCSLSANHLNFMTLVQNLGSDRAFPDTEKTPIFPQPESDDLTLIVPAHQHDNVYNSINVFTHPNDFDFLSEHDQSTSMFPDFPGDTQPLLLDFSPLLRDPRFLRSRRNTPAISIDLNLVMGAWSEHFSKERFNEFHEPFGAEVNLQLQRSGIGAFVVASKFVDSSDNPSSMIGGGIKIRLLEGDKNTSIGIGASALGIKRVDYNGGKRFPVLLPFVSLSISRFSFDVSYIPEMGDNKVSFIYTQMKFLALSTKSTGE
jgi:hypothetical protein